MAQNLVLPEPILIFPIHSDILHCSFDLVNPIRSRSKSRPMPTQESVQMAYVRSISGPDRNGNYQAEMSDGNVMTFGPAQDRNYNDPNRYWFVSVPSGRNHTTYIVESQGSGFEGAGPWFIRKVKEHGDDQGAWRLYAVAVLNS